MKSIWWWRMMLTSAGPGRARWHRRWRQITSTSLLWRHDLVCDAAIATLGSDSSSSYGGFKRTTAEANIDLDRCKALIALYMLIDLLWLKLPRINDGWQLIVCSIYTVLQKKLIHKSRRKNLSEWVAGRSKSSLQIHKTCSTKFAYVYNPRLMLQEWDENRTSSCSKQGS